MFGVRLQGNAEQPGIIVSIASACWVWQRVDLYAGFCDDAGASTVAIHLGRRLPDGSCGLPGDQRAGRPSPVRPCSRWGLPSRPGRPGRWCALTAPFHPCLCAGPKPVAIGGLLSVALSCGSPRLGVTQHRALRSPDVPRSRSRLATARSAATRPTRCRRPAYDASPRVRAAARAPMNPPSIPSALAITS